MSKLLAAERIKYPFLPPPYYIQGKEVIFLVLFYLVGFYMWRSNGHNWTCQFRKMR